MTMGEEESNSMLGHNDTKDGKKEDSGSGEMKMKKELGLTEGVAIILGIIIGSGRNKMMAYIEKEKFTCYSLFRIRN